MIRKPRPKKKTNSDLIQKASDNQKPVLKLNLNEKSRNKDHFRTNTKTKSHNKLTILPKAKVNNKSIVNFNDITIPIPTTHSFTRTSFKSVEHSELYYKGTVILLFSIYTYFRTTVI